LTCLILSGKKTKKRTTFDAEASRKEIALCSRSPAVVAPLSLSFLDLLLLSPLFLFSFSSPTIPHLQNKQVVEERRHWPKFGDALNESATDSITVRANEEIPFERARAARQTTEERKASDMKSVLQGTDKSAIVGSLKDLLYKRRMERQLAAARGLISGPEMPPMEDEGGGGGAGGAGGLLPAAGAKGGYVPPSVRNRGAGGAAAGGASMMGESMHRRGDDNSVRVTNLSEDTREDDLRVRRSFFELFHLLFEVCFSTFLFQTLPRSAGDETKLIPFLSNSSSSFFSLQTNPHQNRTSSRPSGRSRASTSPSTARPASRAASASSTSSTEPTGSTPSTSWMGTGTTRSSCGWSGPPRGRRGREERKRGGGVGEKKEKSVFSFVFFF